MSSRQAIDIDEAPDVLAQEAPQLSTDALKPLLTQRPTRLGVDALPEIVLGELVAIADDGHTAVVLHEGLALRARSVVDLHGAHIGRSVVLAFENGDAARPIVMGVLRGSHAEAPEAPGHVQVVADGERMVISAREQMVLQCGKASITLTRSGKVLIQGSYVSSRSSGVNRLKGGSVQLN